MEVCENKTEGLLLEIQVPTAATLQAVGPALFRIEEAKDKRAGQPSASEGKDTQVREVFASCISVPLVHPPVPEEVDGMQASETW